MAKKKVEQEPQPPELKTVMWDIDNLKEYGRNPRKNDEVVDRMISSIQEFGFRIPVVAKSDGTIVDGHLRFKAAKKMGMARIPVALADELSDAQVKAFRLLANRSANWASWDDDLLKLEFEELKDMDFSIELTGFDDIEFKKITGETEAFEPDLPDENDGSEKEPTFILRVEFSNEDQQQMIFTELRDRGYKVKV